MNGRKLATQYRLFALLLLAVVLFSVCFGVFSSEHEGHCKDECCDVCLLIRQAQLVWRTVFLQSALAVAALIMPVLTLFFIALVGGANAFSLENLKVRLND